MFVSQDEQHAGWQQRVKVNLNQTSEGEKVLRKGNQAEVRSGRKQGLGMLKNERWRVRHEAQSTSEKVCEAGV